MATTAADVIQILPPNSVPPGYSLDWAVTDANSLTASVVTSSDVATARKDMIAKYLAAHFVTLAIERGGLLRDRFGAAEQAYSVPGAPGSPGGSVEYFGLMTTRYGQMAITLDSSGELRRFGSTKQAEFRVV